jgi:hypothetical protein
MLQIQAVNDLGNLVSFILFLAIVIVTAILLYRLLRGRRVRKLVVVEVVCLGVYAVTLVSFSIGSGTRDLALGTDKCFDDWCAAVSGARLLSSGSSPVGIKRLAIELRVSNRARRAAFRPSQPRVLLALDSGSVVQPSSADQLDFEKQAGPQQDLAKRLLSGESFVTTLVFEVPDSTRQASVILLEGPAIITRFLIGDENSFFHRKMVYPLTVE